MMTDDQLKQATFDLLEKTNLNWTVTKESLISTIDNKPTDSYGLFRKDNGAHLATVGSRYEVYQNYELAEALIEATSEINMIVNRGGALNGGGKVYLQAELPEIYIGKSGMKKWITGVNSHDGLRSIGFGSTGTVIVCQNTWHMAYGQLSKFKHTVTAKERVLEFIKGMRVALGLDNQTTEILKIMAASSIKDEIFSRIIKQCFDVNMDESTEKLSTKQVNKLKSVSGAIETELKLEGATLWGLFNGITRYTNHIAVKPEKATDYVMTGGGYETNLIAYKTIKDWMIDQKLIAETLINQ